MPGVQPTFTHNVLNNIHTGNILSVNKIIKNIQGSKGTNNTSLSA